MPITGLTYVTLTGTFANLQTGNPSTGNVRLTGAPRLVNQTTNQVVIPSDFVAVLDADGAFSMDVPSTEDADFLPAEWSWVVKEFIDGQVREYAVRIPTSPSTVDISDLAPLDPVDARHAYTLAGVLDGTFDGTHLIMRGSHLWVDATGDLRIKTSQPSSDLDGTVVGTQS